MSCWAMISYAKICYLPPAPWLPRVPALHRDFGHGQRHECWSRNLFLSRDTNNPISAQPVIDAGVTYIRNHPNSENAADVYKVLADAYEERGMFDKAISYHQLAGAPKEKIAALRKSPPRRCSVQPPNRRSRRARILFDQRDRSASRIPAAAEATKKLAELAKGENQGLRMSKAFLKEHPELFGPRGLGLKASFSTAIRATWNSPIAESICSTTARCWFSFKPLGVCAARVIHRPSHHRSLLRHPAREKSSGRHGRRQSARQG